MYLPKPCFPISHPWLTLSFPIPYALFSSLLFFCQDHLPSPFSTPDSLLSLCLFSQCLHPWCRAPTNLGTEGVRIKDNCSRRMRRISSLSSVTISRTDALRNVCLDGDRCMIPRTFSGCWAPMSKLKMFSFLSQCYYYFLSLRTTTANFEISHTFTRTWMRIFISL